MSFHPKMYARTKGFLPLDDVRVIALDGMVIDYWTVQGTKDAKGSYASLHPRLTLLFDGAKLAFHSKDWSGKISCSACFVPAGLHVMGTLHSNTQFRHLDIHLHRDLLRQKVGRDVDLQTPAFLPNRPDIRALGKLIAGECMQRLRSDLHLHALVDTLFMEVFHARETREQENREATWLAQIRAHIHANLGRQITIDDLAARAELSRTQFNRRFRAETGCSPYQWVKQARIREAQALILAGQPLAQVADAMGFADQAHFNRSFKSVTGKAPSLWMFERQSEPDGPNVQDKLA